MQGSKNTDIFHLQTQMSSTSWSLRYPPSSVFLLTFLWRKDGSVYSLFSLWPPSFLLCPSSFKAHPLYLSALSPTPVLLPGKPHGQGRLMGCSPWGREESDATEQLHFHFSLSCIGEGIGNPLQCSCLENPRDGGAWWAAVYGVSQSRAQLKWLSSSTAKQHAGHTFILWDFSPTSQSSTSSSSGNFIIHGNHPFHTVVWTPTSKPT